MDSNAGNATCNRIESKAYYLIKNTVVLLLHVQFHQFHCRHITHEVKFYHESFKNYLMSRSYCKNLLKTAAAKTNWGNT